MRRYALICAAALLTALLAAKAEGAKPDYCANDGRNVVVYVDVTTPYDEIDKRGLVAGIDQIYETLKGGDRLSIRTIEDSFPRSVRLAEACVPYCPPSGIFGDLFSSCTEGVVINETKALRHNIAETLGSRLGEAAELTHSDIIRTIALTSDDEFREGSENDIYIFSDMIENSEYLPGARFFASQNAETIERLSTDRLIPTLIGARVTIFGIGRGGGQARNVLPQDRMNKLEDFWHLFFAAAGASATLK
jgi:hypothetical protein